MLVGENWKKYCAIILSNIDHFSKEIIVVNYNITYPLWEKNRIPVDIKPTVLKMNLQTYKSAFISRIIIFIN